MGLYCSGDGEMNRENVLFVTSHSEACLSGLTSAHATTELPWKLQATEEKVQDRGYELSSVILSSTVDYSVCVVKMVTRH